MVAPAKLKEFLNAYFEKPGTEFESWTPPDWHDKWEPVNTHVAQWRVFRVCLIDVTLFSKMQAKVPGRNSRRRIKKVGRKDSFTVEVARQKGEWWSSKTQTSHTFSDYHSSHFVNYFGQLVDWKSFLVLFCTFGPNEHFVIWQMGFSKINVHLFKWLGNHMIYWEDSDSSRTTLLMNKINDFSCRSVQVLETSQNSTRKYTPHTPW